MIKKANDLVSIIKVYDIMTAELIKAHLDDKGIASCLKSDNAGGALSYFTTIVGIEITVCKQDAEAASKIIQEWHS